MNETHVCKEQKDRGTEINGPFVTTKVFEFTMDGNFRPSLERDEGVRGRSLLKNKETFKLHLLGVEEVPLIPKDEIKHNIHEKTESLLSFEGHPSQETVDCVTLCVCHP